MSTQNEATARRFFEEVCNRRKLEVADEIFTADHVHHDPANPNGAPGPRGIKDLVSIYQVAFPDAHWAIDEILSAGDNVVIRWTGTGTHKNDLQGLTPTGRQVKVSGIWIQRFSGGKIVESWDVWDTLGMLQQLGAVPAMGNGAAQSARQSL